MPNHRFSPPFRKISNVQARNASVQGFQSLPRKVDCRIYAISLLAICLFRYSVSSTDSSVEMVPSSGPTGIAHQSAHERTSVIMKKGSSTNLRPVLVLLPVSKAGIQMNHSSLSLALAETPHNQTTMVTSNTKKYTPFVSTTTFPSLKNSTASSLQQSRRAMEDKSTFPAFHQIIVWVMLAATALLLVTVLSNLRFNQSCCSRQNEGHYHDEGIDDDNSEHDYDILYTSNAREIGYGSFSRTGVWQGNYSDKFDV